jgi:hypothetical protein
MEDFPGNSHSARISETPKPASEKSPEENKPVKKVVSGKVTQRPKPIGKRLKDMFITDGGNFGEYLVEKVVVPMVKDMVLSIIEQSAAGFRQGVEEKLFGPDDQGNRRRAPTTYGSGRPVVNYTRYSSSSTVRRSADRPPGGDTIKRRSNQVKEYILEDREDADMVLEELDAMIDSDLGHCTVGDFYSLMGDRPRSTDEEWGWTDLSTARVTKLSPNEYLIAMPRPKPIEN